MLGPRELDEVYAAIGAAVWHLQFLEDVLVTYLAMQVKLRPPFTPDRAYEVLASERRRTLGALMSDAKAAGLLGSAVAEASAVLDERNWLIHRSMHEANDGLYNEANRRAFMARVRGLAERSIKLKKRLYGDVTSWCEAQGIDLERAEAAGLERFRTLRDA